MKLKCRKCGKYVSTEVPDNTVVRAVIECPGCCSLEEKEKEIEKAIRNLVGKIYEDCYGPYAGSVYEGECDNEIQALMKAITELLNALIMEIIS